MPHALLVRTGSSEQGEGRASSAASKPFGLSVLLNRYSSPSTEGLWFPFELYKAATRLY